MDNFPESTINGFNEFLVVQELKGRLDKRKNMKREVCHELEDLEL